MTDEKRSVIELDHVRKQYGDFVAVHDANFSIANGEFFAMLGPSGCGKTTTLKMIAGFEQPTSGRVLLDGEDVSSVPPYRRNVNTVFQQYALFPHMTVFDNVAFGPRSTKKLDEARIKKDVMEMLEVVRLDKFANRKPSQLSGGQQQRVALARALVNFPSALLLDEPLAALDLKLREAMQIELKRIQREVGISFVFVTHDQGEAITMSDRIAVMSEGQVEQIGTPEQIYRSPASLFVAGFIGSANLLPATVESNSGQQLHVRTTGGALLNVPKGDATFSVGDRVCVMLRPERLQPAQSIASAGSGVEGTLTDLVYQGATARLIVRQPDDTELSALVDATSLPDWVRAGAAICLVWPSDCPYVLAGWPERAGATTTNVDHVEAAL
ncbi:MAG: ABC transporter ATP-binding protein [Ilumatobacteraceae bacterium]